MKKESGVTRLKLIIIIIVSALIVYILFSLNNSNKGNKAYNFINEENKVIYVNSPVDSNIVSQNFTGEILSINEVNVDPETLSNKIPVEPKNIIDPTNNTVNSDSFKIKIKDIKSVNSNTNE